MLFRLKGKWFSKSKFENEFDFLLNNFYSAKGNILLSTCNYNKNSHPATNKKTWLFKLKSCKFTRISSYHVTTKLYFNKML